jgi:hypothetical protein
MRMLLPDSATRAWVTQHLTIAFHDEHHATMMLAVRVLCGFYAVPTPRIYWRQRIDKRKNKLAWCYECGTRIDIIHPEVWKEHRPPYDTCTRWVQTLLHECGHLVLWSDRERKADLFAKRWVR